MSRINKPVAYHKPLKALTVGERIFLAGVAGIASGVLMFAYGLIDQQIKPDLPKVAVGEQAVDQSSFPESNNVYIMLGGIGITALGGVASLKGASLNKPLIGR
jgi:hypothetical protein